jgi:hypothetical protein
VIGVDRSAAMTAKLLNEWVERHGAPQPREDPKAPWARDSHLDRTPTGKGKCEAVHLRICRSSVYHGMIISLFGAFMPVLATLEVSDPPVRWAALAFVAWSLGMGLYLLAWLLPGRGVLVLTPSGLTENALFRTRSWPWSAFDQFFVHPLGWWKPVAFRSKDSRARSGHDGTLFRASLPPDLTVDLLNDWVRRYGDKPQPDRDLVEDWV